MVQDECIVMINSKAHMCKCCAFQNSWKKQMRASHLTHLRERLMVKVLTSEEWAGRGCCSSLPCPGRPMTCRVFNSLLCTLAVWVACSDGHACAQRGQRRTLFALSYPSLLHFPDTESLSEAKAKTATSKPQCPSLLCASHRKGYRCRATMGSFLNCGCWDLYVWSHDLVLTSSLTPYPLNYCSNLHSASFFFSNVLASASLCPMRLITAQPENSPAAGRVNVADRKQSLSHQWGGPSGSGASALAQTQFKYQRLQVLKNTGLIRIKDVIVKLFFFFLI